MTTCWKRTCKFYSTLLIALFELIFIATILALFISYYAGSPNQYNSAGFALPLAGASVAVIIVFFMIAGVVSNRPLLILPHLVAQILSIVLITVFVSVTFLLIFIGRGNYKSFYVGSDFATVYITMAVLCGLMTLAEIYFFFVVKNCYDKMKYAKVFDRDQKQVSEASSAYWKHYWSYWINNLNSIECPQKHVTKLAITKTDGESEKKVKPPE